MLSGLGLRQGQQSPRSRPLRSWWRRLGGVVLSLDQLPEWEQPEALSQWEQIDRGIDIDRAQALAAPDVVLAIDLVRHWRATFEDAALMVGLTRAMRRRLARLGPRLRVA